MKQVVAFLILLGMAFSANAQDIASLYRNVNPSVVTINTETRVVTQDYRMATDDGIGSGVLISNDGNILTAAHVVNDAEKIKVKFLNGEEIPAKAVRSASVADLALIKLAWMPKEYSVARLGDSDEVSIGEQIIIVGAPYGLEHSLSVGHISGREEQKTRTSGFTISEFFQTDASINQGNSGGPMFNMDGEVIGISSYIITETGGFQGIGFAATSNVAKMMVVDGKRRWTGINGYLLDKKQAWLLNVPIEGGLLVESIVRFSPADFAGLKGGFERISIDGKDLVIGGDVIVAVNNFTLTRKSFEELIELWETSPEGRHERKSFELKVLRGGQIETVSLDFKE
ncbi:trypsin-like peptidase domain-containing protein [Muricauda sp. SCSIO 64092]|uniref:S1C family serine protease n=1 Tax=Allomuricauda sp. SCSIO 64092 TaxID=2908842 RepID=UPI001FF4D266|nr:trypsin-like peptidase domain-containing protein [Muricauda sp. SCSIO 64092]UOY06181.1 trypsin-like peptidase domain-containing protein [Muricauda sp. SCSIO 64092]